MTARLHALALASALLTAAAASAFVACSSNDDPVSGDPEGGTSDAPEDSRTRVDGGAEGGGNCTAVKGDCDLVLQDCADGPSAQKRECVVSGSGNAFTTRCVPVQGSQQLPTGRACCPNNAGGNPCLPGLSCVGDPCVDGGPVTGRCSPACCEGDNAACGTSQPEGIAGACDITLFDDMSNTELHRVCSYRERCKPFREEPCQVGQTCLVEDQLGTAGCISSQNKPLGAGCTYGNDCADGLFCLNIGDGGVCRMMCLTPGSTHPFDASVEQGGPYRGGCTPGQACNIGPFLNDLPAWLSFCRIDGG